MGSREQPRERTSWPRRTDEAWVRRRGPSVAPVQENGRRTPGDRTNLRHSCAGPLLAAGVAAPKVAAVLRHADTRTTLTVYAGLVESQRADLRDDLEAALR